MKYQKIFIKTIIVIVTILGFAFANPLFAATVPTPSVNPTINEQLNKDLQERIASEVAQKNLVEKRGIIGTVDTVSETQITITDTHDNPRIIDVDELTQFSSPSAKSTFGISDITRGTTIDAVGLYYKDSKHLLARWVDVLEEPTILSGGILSIDKTNYNLTIATEDKDSITIEVEDFTKTTSYTKDVGVIRSGFSHLEQGQRILVVGFPDTANAGDIIASRMLVFPDLPVDPKITLINPTDIAPVTPSTGSGKKLTPMR